MFGGMPLMAKAPSDPVFACLEKLVTGFDSSTIADGTGAPVASLTMPRSVPVPPRDWPAASVGLTQTTQNNANTSAGGRREVARHDLIMANATISTVDNELLLLWRSWVEVNAKSAQVVTAGRRSGPSVAGNSPLARIVCKIRRNSAMLRKANNHDYSILVPLKAGVLLVLKRLPLLMLSGLIRLTAKLVRSRKPFARLRVFPTRNAD